MLQNDIWLATEIFCYIIWSVSIIFCIYANTSMRSYNNEMFMKKRSLSIFYALNGSLIFLMSSLFFAGIAIVRTSLLIIACSCASCCIGAFLLLFVLISKNWIIYYKYHWIHNTLQYKWQRIINPDIISKTEQNWFIANNTTYGNVFYIYKLFGTISVIACMISVIPLFIAIMEKFALIPLFIAILCFSITFCPITLFYAYIVWNTPSFDDAFYIHKESKIHSKLMILFAATHTLTNIAFLIFWDFRLYMVGLFMDNMSLCAMIYTSTIIVHKKQRHHSSVAIINPQQTIVNITLEMILSNEQCLHLFMTHLSTEWSMEILLSCIEFNQFQKFLVEHINDKQILEKVKIINFPDTLPQSQIVSSIKYMNDDDKYFDEDAFLNGVKIKAHRLYNKYIASGEFEVNISGMMKDKLSNVLSNLKSLLIHNINLIDLFLVFEGCKQEMITLQSISLERYKHENEFKSVISVFENT
eukprot:425885_1